jgi:hypothetical protein
VHRLRPGTNVGRSSGPASAGPAPVTPASRRKKSARVEGLRPTDLTPTQLIQASGLRDACELDVLLFFSRHPRVVLSSEQLAIYVGYLLPEVARALDLLLGAGLLKRTLNQGAPGRMYVLDVEHAEEWLESLRRVCATPEGRNALKALLKSRRPPNGQPSPRRRSGPRPA